MCGRGRVQQTGEMLVDIQSILFSKVQERGPYIRRKIRQGCYRTIVSFFISLAQRGEYFDNLFLLRLRQFVLLFLTQVSQVF